MTATTSKQFHGSVNTFRYRLPFSGTAYPRASPLFYAVAASKFSTGNEQGNIGSHGPSRIQSIAFLMDADQGSCDVIDYFWGRLQQEGHIAEAKLFAEPERARNPTWASLLAKRGIELRGVSRECDSLAEPNDDAIRREVRGLLRNRRVQAIALLANDKDFFSIVAEVVHAGLTCIVCCPSQRPGFAQQVKKIGAHVLQPPSRGADYQQGISTIVAVLRADGTGAIEPNLAGYAEISDSDRQDIACVTSTLQLFGYRPKENDPVVASIAKFWFTNELGEVAVFPTVQAVRSAAVALRAARGGHLISSREGLSFVIPAWSAGIGKNIVAKYGTRQAAQYAKGGGPFILHDSSDLAERFLQRMGYIDEVKNTDVPEAVNVFLRATANQSQLRKIGLRIDGTDRTIDKLQRIRSALLSSGCSGVWQTPPRDGKVRRELVARGILSMTSSTSKVHVAMAEFVKSSGVKPTKSYHALINQCLDILSCRLANPRSRKPVVG